MAIGGRRAIAAYAASISLRTSTSFSVHTYSSSSPTLVLPTVFLRRASTHSHFAMSAATSSESDVKVDIASNMAAVRHRMDDAISSSDRPPGSVRLVAVSKTKPLELLQAAYEVRSQRVDFFDMMNVA